MNTILKLNYLTVPDNIRRGRCELYLQYLYKTPLHFGLSSIHYISRIFVGIFLIARSNAGNVNRVQDSINKDLNTASSSCKFLTIF
ncbi:unnamed protein product [Leptidea sinapis]|uniref:Uncharacterized protein n=1 Tax=Leptidea sinapis TaxID=189913 RepID=A0A5E4PNH1_9NEOP|nr:unnamed protein product [Leptidea sinapis]